MIYVHNSRELKNNVNHIHHHRNVVTSQMLLIHHIVFPVLVIQIKKQQLMKHVKLIFLDVLLMVRGVYLKLQNVHNIKELKHNVINFKEYQDYKNVQIVILQPIIRHVIKNNV